MKKFIQAIGTHGSGKSRVISSVALSYGIRLSGERYNYSEDGKILILGGYKERKDGTYTGGFDSQTMTTNARQRILREVWKDNADVVMTEGFILNYNLATYINWYKTLHPRRQVILLYLNPPLDIIKSRVLPRGGNEWNKKREANIFGKARICDTIFKRLREDSFFIVEEFGNKSTEDLISILQFVERVTEIKMRSYVTCAMYSKIGGWK